MPSKTETIIVGKFTEGLQTNRPAQQIPDGASPFMNNVDLGRAFDGVLSKRRGIDTRHAELNVFAYPRITGLWQFVRFDAGSVTGGTGSPPTPDVITKYIYASANEDIYEVSGNNWTSRYHNDSIDGTDVNFATFNNLIISVNENTATQKGQGGAAMSTLLGTPPANGKFITNWKGRLWIANTSAGRYRVHWSAAGNGQDWVTVGDAGFVDVDPDDGDEITGLRACGEYLYIFKRHAVYVLSGYKPDNFVLQRVPNLGGCIYHRTIADNGAFVIYLSDKGIHSISSGGSVSGELSPLIRYDIENLTEAVKQGAAGGMFNDRQYWLSYDSDNDGINDSAYVLNLMPQIQAWTHYTNIKASIFLSLSDAEFISGGDDKVIIRTHDVGDDDEGSLIPFEWRSKDHEITSSYDLKKLLDIGVSAGPLTGKTITITTFVDGIDSGDTITMSLTPTLGGSQSNIKLLSKMLQGQQGNSFYFVFTNNEADAPIEIYDYSAMVEIIGRQYSE